MKLFSEAIVALAIAVMFALLTFGAVAREDGKTAVRSDDNA